MPVKKKVALLGTVDTNWRENVKMHLANDYEVLDNTDDRWNDAKTAEQIEPLLAQDLAIVHEADVVIWYHDAGAFGATACIELGYLAAFSDSEGVKIKVHVELNVAKREYMRALVLHHPNMSWAECWSEVYNFIER